MKKWYVGIDESGSFDSYNKKMDHSFVCAVVTQKDVNACERLLKDCAKEVNADKYKQATGSAGNAGVLAGVIKNFYHGMDLPQAEVVNILNTLIPKGKDIGVFKHVFCSKQEAFVGSAQHYYMASLQNVLSSVFESGLIQKGDEVTVYVAERIPEVIGNVLAADLVMAKLKSAANKERKKTNKDENLISLLESSAQCVFEYGGPHKGSRKVQDVPTTAYERFLEEEQQKVQLSVYGFLSSAYPWCQVTVKCCSAKVNALPAIADQAINALHYRGKLKPQAVIDDVVYARSHKLVKGDDVAAYVEEGDYAEALRIFVDQFYQNMTVEESLLTAIFQQSVPAERDSLWSLLVEQCRQKMDSRGVNGAAIQKTKRILEIMDQLIIAYKPSNKQVMEYLQMKDIYSAHDGDTVVSGVERSIAEIKNYRDFSDNYKDYQEYCQLYIDQVIGSLAQVRFNNYDFRDDEYRGLLMSYKTRFEQESHFFGRHKNFKDDNYAKILGTIGQSLAFRGNAKEAVTFFELDYEHASCMLNYPASYLVVTYLALGDFEKAKYWFLKQAQEILGSDQEWSIAKIRTKIDRDMWLALNYFRLYAYSQNHEVEFESDFPVHNMWGDNDGRGDYPWCLLLKWLALIYLQSGRENWVGAARNLLNKSIDAIESSDGFTIKTMLLPVLKMRMIVMEYAEQYVTEYKKQYESLIAESSYFKEFVKAVPVLDPDDRSTDLWAAATALPFNYS